MSDLMTEMASAAVESDNTEEEVDDEVDRLIDIIDINISNMNKLLDEIGLRLQKQVDLQEGVIADLHNMMKQQDLIMKQLRFDHYIPMSTIFLSCFAKRT